MQETILKKLARPMLLLATLIWGTTFFILKGTLDDVSVPFMVAFRFSLAALVLAVVFHKRFAGIDKSYFYGGALMGLWLFCAYTVQNYGLMGTTPGKNAFFTAVYCVIVPFLYWVVNRVRPDRYHVLAALLCIAGIGLVSWDGGFFLNLGDVLTLIGGLFYALHIVTVSHVAEKRDIFVLTVIQFATTALLSWGLVWFVDGMPTTGMPMNAWVSLLYMALAATALALLLQNVGQKYTPPAAAAVLLSLEAPFGVFFSMLFYHERPTLVMILGFCVIFLAVICSETKFSFLKKRVDIAS